MHQVPALEFMINQNTGTYTVETGHQTKKSQDGGLQGGVGAPSETTASPSYSEPSDFFL